MHFFTLKNRLKDFIVFSIKEIEKIDPGFHKQRLSEWQKKGYIKKIRREFYVFSDIQLNEEVLFVIANTIYRPSYVSLEMALSLHALIPESVYGLTSVTSLKTNHFKTDFGYFSYKHIKPELMFGYELKGRSGAQRYLVAGPEKTVLDYLYLNPHIKDEKDFEGLRFNVTQFKAIADIRKLQKYLEVFDSKALSSRVSNFIKFIENAQPDRY